MTDEELPDCWFHEGPADLHGVTLEYDGMPPCEVCGGAEADHPNLAAFLDEVRRLDVDMWKRPDGWEAQAEFLREDGSTPAEVVEHFNNPVCVDEEQL